METMRNMKQFPSSRFPNVVGKAALLLLCSLSLAMLPSVALADAAKEVAKDDARADGDPYPALRGLSQEDMALASQGCVDCHTASDQKTMHASPGVVLGCANCHGGDPKVRAGGLEKDSAAYDQAKAQAHVQPDNPDWWPTSANPEGTYTNLLKESFDFVRFINPGDLRVAEKVCGDCHASEVRAVRKSLMTTSAMLMGGAAYNNNILPYKNYILGEAYGADGQAQKIVHKGEITEEGKKKGQLASLIPLPQWEAVVPGDFFRIFERGGLRVLTQFPEIGNPNPLEVAGKPDVLQSNRGPGTGARISVPVLNIHKTRLNDPHNSFMGTNDAPGDYRNSGCTGCHVIYANNREWEASGPYAKYGNEGKSFSADPTIPKDESGHPIKHEFTRGIPTAQCMNCHMHQPNMFVNTYLGYTMWDYESDAPFMWPEKQKFPSHDEMWSMLNRNPEEAVIRGKWSDPDFLKDVSLLNPQLKNTQFADYHGHGWNFRAIFKKDSEGNLLDEAGKKVSHDDPKKFDKAVHMMDIHAQGGMQCSDCHFAQDSHGDGHIYGEVAQAVEIMCKDCHGSATKKATLKTSGPAAPEGGNDLRLMRTQFGDKRFNWVNGELWQYSNIDKDLKWRVSQVVDSINPASAKYNPKAAKAKLVKKLGANETKATKAAFGTSEKNLAHSDNENMACYTCHTSWTTSCGGCHLPIQANWKQKSKHYDGKTTRNWATYNPQVVRDQIFQIGRHGPAKDGRIVPIRSSSALVLSSKDINRQIIYTQQPPVSAAGFSSQAFAPHFPHTVRKTETKQCADCHVSSKDDNNAIMAQLLLHGTNFVNFLGYHAYVATADDGFEAIQVTEWDEPQAVIGSYLHKYAYPQWFGEHEERGKRLETSRHHSVGVGIPNPFASNKAIRKIQLRGEYVYTAGGSDGFRVYDAANVSNKGFSERIVTAPFSPLGHDTHVSSENATSFALPTNQPVAPHFKQLPENLEQPMHAIYNYAFITDSEEGLILVNVNTLQDGDRENNFLERALTWNPEGVLSGANYIELAGANAYIGTNDKLVIVDLDDPMKPRVRASLPFKAVSQIAIQFRYAFVTDADGFHVVDVTKIDAPVKVANIPMPDARGVYVARTYAYVSGGSEGLYIIDVTTPSKPTTYMRYDAGGTINDLYDVKTASTNASFFAYLADGKNGLKVLQLTDPERVPTYYGFSPKVKPKLIAWRETGGPAVYVSKPLDRDRAVDETGHQIAVLGRIGSRPLNKEEQEKMYLNKNGEVYTVD